MALKKESNSLGSDQENSLNEDSSLLEFKNLDNKKKLNLKYLKYRKEMIMRMDFSILGLINRS